MLMYNSHLRKVLIDLRWCGEPGYAHLENRLMWRTYKKEGELKSNCWLVWVGVCVKATVTSLENVVLPPVPVCIRDKMSVLTNWFTD